MTNMCDSLTYLTSHSITRKQRVVDSLSPTQTGKRYRVPSTPKGGYEEVGTSGTGRRTWKSLGYKHQVKWSHFKVFFTGTCLLLSSRSPGPRPSAQRDSGKGPSEV